jgi:hypothetical protein
MMGNFVFRAILGQPPRGLCAKVSAAIGRFEADEKEYPDGFVLNLFFQNPETGEWESLLFINSR